MRAALAFNRLKQAFFRRVFFVKGLLQIPLETLAKYVKDLSQIPLETNTK